ncbi:MAG TPA: tetratricopeptide repeat protein [Ktedonobacterales bacterium]|nr:tetratricopeptide repeat protein [Ktedonobacterales bacterium]
MPASDAHNLPTTAKKEQQSTQHNRLKALRLKKHWSQVYVATMIGTNDVTVSRWESGATFPSLYYRQQLCELFGKSAEELGLLPSSAKLAPEDRPTHLSHPAIWWVPYRRNVFFTGRESTLERLHILLQVSSTTPLPQVQALCGLGGVGKTQTALEYAYRYRGDYAAVLWVKADTYENLISDLATLARFLDIPEQTLQEPASTLQAVSHWLAEHRKWLLILDNLEDLVLLHEIIPPECEGCTLVTTRAQVTGTVAERLDLEEMEVEEGVLFLLRRAKYLRPGASLAGVEAADYQRARTIVHLVDALPLALDQAGAYIEESGCGLQDYLERYHTRRAILLNRRGRLAVDHPESVGATLSLSFMQVEQVNPAAVHLLLLCAFLDPDAIPEELFPALVDARDALPQPEVTSPLELDSALAALRRYSLIRRNPATKTLVIHRLVQAILQESMTKETQRYWAERVVRAISRAFPDVYEPVSWSVCQRFWTQALVGVTLIEHWGIRSTEAGQLLLHVGAYVQRVRADYVQAERLFKQAFLIYRRLLGPEHLNLASCMNKLAVLFRHEKKYRQAERFHRRALRIREQMLGPLHPDVGTSLNNLAVLYMDMGNQEEAERLCLRGLAIREQAWGREHPEVTISLHNLASLYYDQGKYQEAEALQQRVLAIREKTLGLTHPDLASAHSQLAAVYREQGKYDQAKELYQRALAILEQALGPDHPFTARTRGNVASLHSNTPDQRQAVSHDSHDVLLLSEYLSSRTRRQR